MEGGCINGSALKMSKKPARKDIEKNRRNHMKFLTSQLFSLIPTHYMSKGGDQVSDRMDRAIEYIQSLKTNLEMIENKKEKLLSRKRSHEHIQTNNSSNSSHDIQIHEMSHDLDVVLVTGLKNHSSFCDVVQLLDQYSAEVALANFSSCGHSTFHIRHKKIEADGICKRIKQKLEGSTVMEFKENASSFWSQPDSDLSVWDFDVHSFMWGLELEVLPPSIFS
uniref:transcription factor bHLH162-like n=1 Tax=Erigeron canadensis TaxID=72917 RepID=UPI001CB9683C|nr:transcription factor bHLH162-like [Erigeron canadensis]